MDMDSFADRVRSASEHLKVHGWAVIEGVLTAEECERAQQGMWEWLEGKLLCSSFIIFEKRRCNAASGLLTCRAGNGPEEKRLQHLDRFGVALEPARHHSAH